MKLFKSKEEKERIKKEKQEEKKHQQYIENLPKCAGCKDPMFPEDKTVKKLGKTYHIACFRDMWKMAKKELR